MSAEESKPTEFPAQHQEERPGHTGPMEPKPQDSAENYTGSGKLAGKVAIVTGGDSGIGRSVSVHFAKEGADVAIVYLNEHEDAEETKRLVEAAGVRCELIPGDIGEESFCQQVVEKTISTFGKLDILVNNAGEQHPQPEIEKITEEQIVRTFRTNIFGMILLTKAASPHLQEGARVINTTSITAFEGSGGLLDYSSTKGAILAFTRSLSQQFAKRKILVNAVAPGPVWTPLIVSTFSEEEVKTFGQDTPLKRAGQPDELAPSYVFLASQDSTYITGQVIHVNGGNAE